MCGIAGIVSLDGQKIAHLYQKLDHMNQLQAHRGPDGQGIWIHSTPRVGLAHRRLSIFDLEKGHQPMTDSANNWLVFNGAIFNYLELREELGIDCFKTRSDTEVILHAYQRWGLDCVEQSLPKEIP